MKMPGLWYLQWEWRRFVEKVQVTAANCCPRWLAYRCCIRVGAHATTGKYGSQNVPELYFIDALQRWDK